MIDLLWRFIHMIPVPPRTEYPEPTEMDLAMEFAEARKIEIKKQKTPS